MVLIKENLWKERNKMYRYKYLISINISVFLFGLAGLFAKWIHISAVGITFGRVLFSSAALIFYTVIKKENLKVEHKDLKILILSGYILALHWWSFLYSIQISTVAIGTITFSAFPLFITILNALRYRKISFQELIISLLIILGVFITIPEFSMSNTMFKGVIVGVISSFLYAILTLFNEYFSKKYSSYVITLYEQTSAVIALLTCIFFIDIYPTFNDIILLIFLGIITTALAHTLFVSSLKKVPPYIAGVISSMETVYSIILAALFLKEFPTIRESIGGLIIVGVVFIIQFLKIRKDEM